MNQRIDTVLSNGVSKSLSLLVLLLFLSLVSHAQDFVWKLTTTSGEEYPPVALQRVSNDTLYFLRNINYADWILVDSISQLSRERRSAILPAMLIGAGGGGAIGFALKPVAINQQEANVYSAAFGVVLGGVAGFLVGSIAQSDEVFELRQLNRQGKIDTLKKVMP